MRMLGPAFLFEGPSWRVSWFRDEWRGLKGDFTDDWLVGAELLVLEFVQ